VSLLFALPSGFPFRTDLLLALPSMVALAALSLAVVAVVEEHSRA